MSAPMQMVKACGVCGAEMNDTPAHLARRMYCSRTCMARAFSVAMKGRPAINRITKTEKKPKKSSRLASPNYYYSEKRRRTMKSYYRWKIEHGLCNCGRPQDREGTRCSRCWDRQEAARRRRVAAKKAAGICVGHGCNDPSRAGKAYCLKCKDRVVAACRASRRAAKAEVMEKLGGRCVRCGFADARALTVQHVNRDGKFYRRGARRHRAAHWHKYKRALMEGAQLTLLCANCHMITDLYDYDENDVPITRVA